MTALALIALLSACGGGNGSSSVPTTSPPTVNQPPPPPPNQSPGGIWQTQYVAPSGDTIDAFALVDESGQVYFNERDQTTGCVELGTGQLTVTGNTVSGSGGVGLVTPPGATTNCTFADGSTTGIVTISGTVSERQSMTITSQVTTANGELLATETHTWTFNVQYDNTSSLSQVAANYWDGPNTFSVDGNGMIFDQELITGCVINGQISIINPQYNMYSITFTFANCIGNYAVDNGVTFTGLATLNTTTNPVQLVLGASANVNGSIIVADFFFPRQ
jgi:hypothetical protein